MGLKDLCVFDATLAVSAEPGLFTFEVDYDVYEGYQGPHDWELCFIRVAVGCLGEVMVLGRVFASHPLYDKGGCTIGVQYIKVALADAADLK